MKLLLKLVLLLPLVANGMTEEISLETQLGPLEGTLQLPVKSKIQAIALIVAGSGATDRNGNIRHLPGNNDSLKMLAESLASQGVATLRYDKRLVGESTSTTLSEIDLRFEHYIADTKDWLNFLAERFEQPLFIIGHSEGSLISIIAASQVPVHGLVSISGVGRPASKVLLAQLREKLPSSLMEEAERVVMRLVGGDTADAPAELDAIFRPSVQKYLISWFKYDPVQEISRLNLPIQIIQGQTDIQVTVEEAIILHDAALESRLDLIDVMNHILKPVSGSLQEQVSAYSDPSLELAPELVPVIVDFIADN